MKLLKPIIMNITRIVEFFSHKTWTWQHAFCNFYLLEHNLYGLKCKTDLEPAMLARRCCNVDDLQEMWSLAEFLDDSEEEMVNIIGTYRYCRPIPWQYDFVETIAEKSGFDIPQTFNLDALTDAYCIALHTDAIDLQKLTTQLDLKYLQLYDNVAEKQNLLKRNFSLALECNARRRRGNNAQGLNFREMIEAYLPSCGLETVVESLKLAKTAETKLSPEERAAFGFAYYSPYFYDEITMPYGLFTKNSIFNCVEEQLQDEIQCRDLLRRDLYRAQDEDEQDDLEDALAETHNAVYVDPQERCVIDTRFGDVLYANVYIERMAGDFLNNALPDYIRYHRGLLYTVEFVDDLKKLDVAKELMERLNEVNQEMLQLELSQIGECTKDWPRDVQKKYEELSAEREMCYYICD